MKYIGRKTPYTEIGINRVPCKRCGKPSSRQWQVCANANRYLGVCRECDLLLNEVVLNFFNFQDVASYMTNYKKD